MHKELDEMMDLDNRKYQLKEEIGALKEQLEVGLREKIDGLKEVLRLKKIQNKLRAEIEEIENAEIILDLIENQTREHLENMAFTDSTDILYASISKIKDEKDSRNAQTEKIFRDEIELLTIEYNSKKKLEVDRINMIKERKKADIAKNSDLLKKISIHQTNFIDPIDKQLKNRKNFLAKTKENAEKLKTEITFRILEARNRLLNEQNASIENNSEIADLESLHS